MDTIHTPPVHARRHPARRWRARAVVGGALAIGALIATAGTPTVQGAERSAPPACPASYHEYDDYPAIAAWARANGLTGLSPVSLSAFGAGS